MNLSSTCAESLVRTVKSHGLRWLVVLCVLLFAASFQAFAQEATIVGTVTDPSGAAVPNASVVSAK